MPQPARGVRAVDFSSLNDRTVRSVLERFDGLVRAVIAKLVARRSGVKLPTLLGEDDLRSIGQLAVLEAYVIYEDRGAQLSTWVYRIVYWRLAEALTVAAEGEPHPDAMQGLDEPVGHGSSTMFGNRPVTLGEILENPEPEPTPEDNAVQARLAAWVNEQIDCQLDMREQAVIDGEMRGVSGASVGRMLGLSRQRMNVHRRTGLRKLQDAASSLTPHEGDP